MGMISGWLNKALFPKGRDFLSIDFDTEEIDNTYYRLLATKASINLIAKTIARIEFQTFEEGDSTRAMNYYMFNVEANINQSAYSFWIELVSKLLEQGEALVIIDDESLFIADSFTVNASKYNKGNVYSNVQIGSNELSKRFDESEVLYFQDTTSSLNNTIKALSSDFGKLIGASIRGYQNSKNRKGKLNIPTHLSKTKEAKEKNEIMINKLVASFMDPSKSSVFTESNGMEYTEISESKGSKSNDSGRETKNFLNDIMDIVAISFGIPPSLLKGDTVDTKDAMNNFLTFCINPLAKSIQTEINRKMYGYELYSKSSYLKADTTQIKSVDLRDIANSIDLLSRNGAYTIDDTLRTLGKEPIGGDVGNLRVITKNNENIEIVVSPQGTQ